MSMKNHLLLGDAEQGTNYVACGQHGLDPRECHVEAEYVMVRQSVIPHVCGRCEATWRKICRRRGQPWSPLATKP